MEGARAVHLEHGCLKVAEYEFPDRLKHIFARVQTLCRRHTPKALVVEKVFMSRNAESVLKLGQARGAAIVAAATLDVATFEYSPNEIKQAVVGRGHADKTQIQYMVSLLLSLPDQPATDAADALAAAICHGHYDSNSAPLGRRQARRWRA